MTRSRLTVLAGVVTVGVGALVAMGAFYLDPARASVGPLPAEGLAFPADTRVIMGFDVKRMVASPFYGRYGKTGRPQAFAELEEKTGLNPERDIDAVYVASRQTTDRATKGDGVVLVVGRFDRHKVSRAIETSHRGVTSKNIHGTTLYLYNENTRGRGTAAVAFLDDETLLMGAQSAVEATLATRAAGSAPLRQNSALTALLEKVKPGSTFWMVGDQTLLANMPTSLPGGGDGTSQFMQLPALKSLVVTGDLDPQMSVDVIGEAADEAGAKNLSDVVRGLLALATLQANQKPEMKQLASAVSVTTEANSVRITARFPYELIDALQKQRKPGVAGLSEAPEAPHAPEAPPAPEADR
jgi:hypothetical protein